MADRTAETAAKSPRGAFEGRWPQAVRGRLGLGRLLPLGSPEDGSWLAERAADAVLRQAAARVPGVALGPLRVGLADPDAPPPAPAVPPPPGALPPGGLRVDAEFEASAAEPIPHAAQRLRAALAEAARQRLGLAVTEVDLRVTGLLTEAGRGASPDAPGGVPEHASDGPTDDATEGGSRDAAEKESPAAPPGGQDSPEAAASRAAAAVPGVARLTGVLGAPVRYDGAALPAGHVRVEVAVGGERRAVDVAREVRAAVAAALPGPPSVTVLVTEVRQVPASAPGPGLTP
ncbi:nucleopolyhedrovirus P10 family protein [Streptomyces cremeus]|uniref:Nucleopolyhedrovirus P10 family protein n=1 Tax=Streptomyces cremeus TaxID=66881 RepID=A0ABV5PBL2_STRCM